MFSKSETAESRPKGSRGKSRAACGLGRRRERKDFSFRNGPPGFANKKAVRHSRSVSEETGKECFNGSFRIFFPSSDVRDREAAGDPGKFFRLRRLICRLQDP
jgi:hypothetical protein